MLARSLYRGGTLAEYGVVSGTNRRDNCTDKFFVESHVKSSIQLVPIRSFARICDGDDINLNLRQWSEVR